MLLYATTISSIVILMRKIISGLVICILFLTSITLGCFEEGGNKKSNKPPIADAGEDFEVLSLTEVQFFSTNSTDADGKIVSYHWDFGDYNTPGKETSDDASPKYTYNFPGKYHVSLTVVDDDESESMDQINVTVTNRKPEIEIGSPVIALVFEIIYFNDTATDFDGYIASYEWDFDGDLEYDWYSAGSEMTTHFYDSPGVYNATLKVTDDFDTVTTAVKSITILEHSRRPPVADAGLNQSAPVGQVLLKGTGFDRDGYIVWYEWDFDGDGSYDWHAESSGIINHSYTTEGVYIAKLRVTDDSALTATDIVTIIINNSIITQNISARIFVNWDSGYNYIISLNNTANTSQLKVVITDIISDKEEEFDNTYFIELSPKQFKITSDLEPAPGHSIQVQVLYYDKLIGARALDIVNESYKYISPELDFKAVYDLKESFEVHNSSSAEILRVTSIGEYALENKGDLYYTSLHGTGVYYIKETVDGGESETVINCTDLWVNVTISNSKIISNSISLTGFGTLVAIYEEFFHLDIELIKVRLVRENEVYLENYIYGEGTFSGSITDPESGGTTSMSGDVRLTSELLGTGKHKNWEKTEYPCMIQRVNVTMEGESDQGGSIVKIPFTTTVINTTWNVDFEKYSNNTIYYEYTAISKVANLDEYSEGSGYPENSPSVKAPELHIQDAIAFETPRPSVLFSEDSVILQSKHGVKLHLEATGESESTINYQKYDCVEFRGEFIEGATGYIKGRLISTGSFEGMAVSEEQDIYWRDEWLKEEMLLKKIG